MLVVTTHGNNEDCPEVKSGKWNFCIGHKKHEYGDDLLVELAKKVNPCNECNSDGCSLARHILVNLGYTCENNHEGDAVWTKPSSVQPSTGPETTAR